MSSFKRRTPSKHTALLPGTRACPASNSTILTSSGIPSLDDILGGGVPLSCSLAILAPDPQSSYGELVQKYFIAQGIANGHTVCIVHEDGPSFVKECMWMPMSSSDHPISVVDEDNAVQDGEKIKIAWRYERMKRFETTVTNLSVDHFCHAFDLTCRIPASVLDEACNTKRLISLNLTVDNDPESSINEWMRRMNHVLATTPSTDVVRLCIPSLGSPEWGEYCPADLLRFLYALRRLLRRYSHACACISLAPHFCTDLWTESGWVQKVGWVTDATISMTSFGANPGLTALFPSHHGLVQIHKLPTPSSIVPASDKYSTLRGLSSSAAATIGTGENNLAFKCTRRRLMFETMHLDLEGGVTERRTTPWSTASTSDVGLVHAHVADKARTRALASVAVELEESVGDVEHGTLEGSGTSRGVESGAAASKTREVNKAKKKVAFHSDRPELYDF